ncbi:hypothetical protein D0C16_11425 [Cellvibrio sp. KY-GH-1]|uniref:hypothetical protein n=1 Tax=Cellvibrio sp. KY-GH-1 TaxID=2303332 RepID=UPI001245693E|nr:hypothetical protein [Cellvibrio sp. KY-GH-1]QEY16536.1 hypothetical protein D0C16_11425 [Cellvibrio sp. KY-GH-1]
MWLALFEVKIARYFAGNSTVHYSGLWAGIFFLWVLFFPYAGIMHDAQLYTLQALSHLAPELYQNDIFLRFGSQDSFTLFSPVYAVLIELLGVESAGALITLAGHCLFFSAVFLLAKRILSYSVAIFSVGLILVLSSSYGSERVFFYIEPFVTPRMLSEAFTLFFIAAWLDRKKIAATALLLVALLLHPLMGMAGVIFALSSIYMAHWRRLCLLAVAVIALLLIANNAQLLTRWQFDAEWLSIIEDRNTYLFFYFWSMDDIANALVPLISLISACIFVSGDTEKRLAVAAVFTCVLAVLVHGIGGDVLHLTLVTQGQAWRWFWLVTLVAILLLPNLILKLWEVKAEGKTVAITLIAAWLMRSQLTGLVVAVWALVLVLALKKNWGTVLFWAFSKWMGIALLFLPVLLLVVVSHFHIGVVTALFDGSRLQDFSGVWHECALPLYLFFVCVLVYVSAYKTVHIPVIFSFFLAACLAFWCLGKSWVPENRVAKTQRLERLRELIPIGEDVFTFGPPATIWISLQRPSYLSGIQMAGIVFSRATAVEANRREKAILLLCPSTDMDFCKRERNQWIRSISDFTPFCKTAGVRFVMSSFPLAAKGLIEAKLSGNEPSTNLYQCDNKQTHNLGRI